MKTIFVCTNLRPFTTQPSCAQRGSEAVASWLEEEIERRGLNAHVERSICLGHCLYGPNVRLLGGDFYHTATEKSLAPLLDLLDVTGHS